MAKQPLVLSAPGDRSDEIDTQAYRADGPARKRLEAALLIHVELDRYTVGRGDVSVARSGCKLKKAISGAGFNTPQSAIPEEPSRPG